MTIITDCFFTKAYAQFAFGLYGPESKMLPCMRKINVKVKSIYYKSYYSSSKKYCFSKLLTPIFTTNFGQFHKFR